MSSARLIKQVNQITSGALKTRAPSSSKGLTQEQAGAGRLVDQVQALVGAQFPTKTAPMGDERAPVKRTSMANKSQARAVGSRPFDSSIKGIHRDRLQAALCGGERATASAVGTQ